MAEEKRRNIIHHRIDSLETRAKILEAAERLFLEYEFEEVTLSKIRIAAGQRNRSAIQYHFGTKDEIVREIVARHETDLRRQVDGRLSKGAESLTIQDVVEAMVIPVVAKLDDSGGVAYIRIMDRIIGYYGYMETDRHHDYVGSNILVQTANRLLDAPTGERAWFLEMIVWWGMLWHSLANYSRLREVAGKSPGFPSKEKFADYLIAVMVAGMQITPRSRLPEDIAKILKKRFRLRSGRKANPGGDRKGRRYTKPIG